MNEARQENMDKIAAFMDEHYVRDNTRESVVDLMTDLMHLAKQKGVYAGEAVQMAEMHFNAELDEVDDE